MQEQVAQAYLSTFKCVWSKQLSEPKKGQRQTIKALWVWVQNIICGAVFTASLMAALQVFPHSVLCHVWRNSSCRQALKGWNLLTQDTSVLFPLSSSDPKAVPAPLEPSVWDYFSYTDKLWVWDIPLGVPWVEFCFSPLLFHLWEVKSWASSTGEIWAR